MKKITTVAVLFLLSLIASPLYAANVNLANNPAPFNTEKAEIIQMTERLNEIKTMEKAGMTSSEKKALRKEVRSIKDRMDRMDGKVYISLGALIIIALLLILLL